MKVLLLDPQDTCAQELKDLTCAIKDTLIVSGEQTGLLVGASSANGIDVIVSGGDVSSARHMIESLLGWRTHAHTCLVPCWVATEFKAFEQACLWPQLSIDRFNKQIDSQDVCDWLAAVAEWQQTRMHFSKSDSFRRHSPLEIVNSLALRKATGRLTVFDNEGEEGALSIHQGCLANAKVKHLIGEEAFYEFFTWSSGSYLWEPLGAVEGPNGNQPLQTLVEEGLTLFNDANILFDFIPDLACRIERTESESALDDGGVHFFKALKKIYNLINGSTSAVELIQASPLSRPRTMSCLAKWFSLGDIKTSFSASSVPCFGKTPGTIENRDTQSMDAEMGSSNTGIDSEEFGPSDDFLAVLDDLQASMETIGSTDTGNQEVELLVGIAPEMGDEKNEIGLPVEIDFTPELPEMAQSDLAITPIRLLIVDDSRFMCIALQNMFSNDPRFQIVGVGHDGLEALKLVGQLKPDVVTLDMQMPRMDGLTALKHIMIREPKPVVVLSAFTKETSQLTYESFKYGAIDVLTKPSRGSLQQEGVEANSICGRVADAAGVRLEAAQYIRRGKKGGKLENRAYSQSDINVFDSPDRSIFVMCCGMGGFPALLKFLFSISALDELPPIVTCISMPERAVEALVPNLQRDCEMEIEMVSTGARLKSGACYVFSHELCCHISREDGRITVEKHSDCKERRPFDHLLTSAGEYYRERSIALLLSGTGNDGVEGMRVIQNNGGLTLALSPESCLKPELPQKVLNDRLAQEVKTPRDLIRLIESRRDLLFGKTGTLI